MKIEIRSNCKICGKVLGLRYRTYCSKSCRQKANNRKYAVYQRNWSQQKRGQYHPDKLKCALCGNWYVQVGSHVYQVHHLTAREYREVCHFPVKRGIVPSWYRQLKGDIALDNGTYQNLNKGSVYRFAKGDPRAKKVSGYKGKRYPKDDYVDS